ncbi:2-polyprenyl-3-methyl-5-hydroxy-6-metoxy-1,4-benzoquinol methylase [Methanococcus voltae]|uniref:class I SAM-dependent methyltransferase n=1 Tax=Methanococcus voltae TaxID=2188 RepID=UPI001AE10FCA|nr:methyltransferase domain-containing protein [Methanococcus voltae]MBP2143467.1 2-polyprenyl-3-methyl-5-hydroxy-6-metoxy-1,4-benzoquinol methylase [Methanococcus voltae]
MANDSILKYKHDYLINACKGKKVLHIGASDYPYHEERVKKGTLLHQKLNKVADVIGLDISRDAIRILNENGVNNVYYGDIVENEYDEHINNQKFDIIIFPDVIEHLSKPGQALENLTQFCNPNTRIIITAPNAWSILELKNHFRTDESVHPDHCFWTSAKTLTKLCEFSGYGVKKITYTNSGASTDKLTFKGKIFRNIVDNFPHMRNVLILEISPK